MNEKQIIISKSIGVIEIPNDQFRNFQILVDSSVWNNIHQTLFPKQVNIRRPQWMFYSFFVYRCKHFQISYTFDEEGVLIIKEIEFHKILKHERTRLIPGSLNKNIA